MKWHLQNTVRSTTSCLLHEAKFKSSKTAPRFAIYGVCMKFICILNYKLWTTSDLKVCLVWRLMKYGYSLTLLCYINCSSAFQELVACCIPVLVSIAIFYGIAWCKMMKLQTLVLIESNIIITTRLAIYAAMIITIDIFRCFIHTLSKNNDYEIFDSSLTYEKT